MKNDPSNRSDATPPASGEPPLATRYVPRVIPTAAQSSEPKTARTDLSYATPVVLPYTSARRRAKVLVWLIWLMILIELVGIWLAFERLSVTRARLVDETLSDEPTPAALNVGTVAIFVVIVYVVCWMMWVHRTYRNLPALGAGGLRFTPGWAVGCYFIPILNLWWPFRVMRETWIGSDPHASPRTAALTLIACWWFLSVLKMLYNVAATWIWYVDPRAGTMHALALTEFGRLPVAVALLALEIVIVRKLTQRQEHRAAAIRPIK